MTNQLLEQLNYYFSLKAQMNPLLDILNKKWEYLHDELKDSMKSLHPWHERVGLEFYKPISFFFGTFSSMSIAQLINRSMKSRNVAKKIIATTFLPCLFGFGGLEIQKYWDNQLFRLEENCPPCYQLKTVSSIVLLPCVHTLLFSSILLWINDIESNFKENLAVKNNTTYLNLTKLAFKNYKLKMSSANLFTKSLFAISIWSLLAYTYSYEQTREFTIIFTKYYENMHSETNDMKKGLYSNKNLYI